MANTLFNTQFYTKLVTILEPLKTHVYQTFLCSRCYKLMFGLFKKKSKQEQLQEQHAKLLKEAFELSKVNRKASDQKTAEAAQIEEEIAKLRA